VICLGEPYPILVSSPRHAVKSYEYIVTWDKPMTGGFPITSYDVRFRKVNPVIHMVVTKRSKLINYIYNQNG